MRKLPLLAASLVLGASAAFAYIDPGTGGIVMTSAWNLIAGLFLFMVGALAVFFKKILNLLKN